MHRAARRCCPEGHTAQYESNQPQGGPCAYTICIPTRKANRISATSRSSGPERAALSKRLPATGIIFRETLPDNSLDWHPAPRRQYIVNLEAGVKLTASDGESRIINTGEVILVEDTTGKGHLSQGIGSKIRRSLFIPVD
jgi:hypothetical protein